MPRKALALIICAVLALSVLCLAACRAPVITKPDEPGTSTKKPETEPATPDEGTGQSSCITLITETKGTSLTSLVSRTDRQGP